MTHRLYNTNMYQFDRPESSYWEASGGELRPHAQPLQEDAKCDVAIIGGGYTGLSAAYHLCRDFQIDTRVVEAGHFGWGASGRNGGFCCVGGTSLDATEMVRRYGIDNTRHFLDSQCDAVELVRQIIQTESIDAHMQGDAELELACSPRGYDALLEYAEFLKRKLGQDTRMLSRQEVRERYVDMPIQAGGCETRPTFGLHPFRYVNGLADAAVRRGAILHDRSEVIEWRKEGLWHCLRTTGGTLRAKNVILATNGFTPEHLSNAVHGRTLPLISSIIATRPLSRDELDAHSWRTNNPAFTALDLLDYFRVLPDQRLLLGGRGSSDGSRTNAEHNFTKLTSRLGELFPAWREVAIDYRWHGLVCLTRRLTPAVGRLDEDASVFFAFGYHGNGVSNATWCGRALARWLAGRDGNGRVVPNSLPRIMQGMPARIPIPDLRLAYVQARIAAFKVTDWWHNRQ